MTFKELADKATRYGVKWAVIKFTFALGALTGMLIMAVVMAGLQASPQAKRLIEAKLEAVQ